MKTSEYHKTQTDNGFKFDVTPALPPKAILPIIIGSFFLLLALLPGVSFIFGAVLGVFIIWIFILFILGILFGGIIIWLGIRDMRPKTHRKPSSFRVSTDTIKTNDHSFSKQDIHRLIIKNGIHDKELIEQYAYTYNETQALIHKERMVRICHSLNLETGGKSYLLAGGMDQTTAFGLLTDVNRIIGFSSK